MKYSQPIVAAWFAQNGLGPVSFEVMFHPTRKWRLDVAWPTYKVAIEVQGGIWTGGRHARGKGMRSDMAKLNAAQLAGWVVLYVEPHDLCMTETVALVRAAMARNAERKEAA